MSAAKNARQAALETLLRCRRDGAWSGASLDGMIRRDGLNRRDAAFASARRPSSGARRMGRKDGAYRKKGLEEKLADAGARPPDGSSAGRADKGKYGTPPRSESSANFGPSTDPAVGHPSGNFYGAAKRRSTGTRKSM